MEQNLTPTDTSGGISHLVDPDLAEQAAGYARGARAPATLRAYAADWRNWEQWCRGCGAVPLPSTPATIGLYLTALAQSGRKVSTISRRLVAIGQAHRVAGAPIELQHPAIREVLAGIRRSLGTRKEAKAALLTSDIRRCIAAMPGAEIGTIRDRAVLLLLFAGAMRRSELAALDVPDLQMSTRRATMMIRRSKTDQVGRGAVIGIPRGKRETCPVRAVERWIAAAGVVDGALFRSVDRHGHLGERLSGAAIAAIVKRAVERIGLDPARYSSHSGRSGFITQASMNGADIGAIGLHARQRSIATTRAYVQEAAALNNPAARAIGL
jgi:site-specific recombinase XerD